MSGRRSSSREGDIDRRDGLTGAAASLLHALDEAAHPLLGFNDLLGEEHLFAVLHGIGHVAPQRPVDALLVNVDCTNEPAAITPHTWGCVVFLLATVAVHSRGIMSRGLTHGGPLALTLGDAYMGWNG